jgi:hypothetical protein
LSTVPGGSHWDEFFVIKATAFTSRMWTTRRVPHPPDGVVLADVAKSRHSTGVILYWQNQSSSDSLGETGAAWDDLDDFWR